LRGRDNSGLFEQEERDGDVVRLGLAGNRGEEGAISREEI